MEKIIIIGAGITGLSAGIHGLLKGYDVEIYEKNSGIGGCCTGWVKDDVYIDNCMHWLTGTNHATNMFRLWKRLGAIDEASNLYQTDYFYKSVHNGLELELSKDLEKCRTDMLKLSDSDSEEINKFIDATSAISKTNQSRSLLQIAKSYPSVYMQYKNRSLNDIANAVSHPLLKKVFTDYIPGFFSSLALICAYATFASGNGKIYSAGSKEFANNILNKFLSLNGKIHLDSEVVKININNNVCEGITLSNQETIKADYVISTIDTNYVFKNLIDENYIPATLKKKYQDNKTYPILSSFQAAYKTPKNNKVKDTLIIDIPETKIGNHNISRVILKDFSYLYPNYNYTVYQIMVFQDQDDYNFWNELKKTDEYNNVKNGIAYSILEHIKSTYELSDITLLDCWTPVTYNKIYNSYCGSYLGFSFTPSAKISSIGSKVLNIDKLYISSIWQSYIGGLPIAARLGEKVIKKNF